MSYTEILATYPKGRKAYSCEVCAEVINKGEKHLARTYIFDNEFISGRMHLECEEMINSLPAIDLDGGWSPGEFERPNCSKK